MFGVVRKGRRRYLKGEQIAALDGIEIRYTGESLDQSDLDVWESVLHAVRLQELGTECRVTSYALLKIMGKSDTGKNRATLHEQITRLRANALELTQGRYSYIGGLIAGAVKDEETQKWVIRLDPELRPLFSTDQFTRVEWAARHALRGHQLAQWLLGFYSTHAQPFALKVATLHRLSGSEAARVDHFREKLRKAMRAVEAATASQGESFIFELRGELVHVRRKRRKRSDQYRSSSGGSTVPAAGGCRSSSGGATVPAAGGCRSSSGESHHENLSSSEW
ncbi:hypothetical protein BI364_07565 [Acidihalobacter yilgarnensis]|uniref:TrfA protein n=1 Tax=Acidihalobacter yilgarnensis TaxID=2819280 RepID=A0A1D8IN46_9GAMM|nr:hypothetical protein BI364_07565 [Acidihalobacter yilgarnensis]